MLNVHGRSLRERVVLFRFVNNWFAPRCNPIGVDFGTDCLRMAQVLWTGTEHKLVAAATADVPMHVRNDPAARLSFFVESVRDLLAQSDFRGRQAMLGLPASLMHVQHLRLPKMDEDALKKALPWETRGKLPIDPGAALLRHIVAGDVYQDQEPREEIIVLAAVRETVNQLLNAAARAKLDIVGMNVEPSATLDCFSHVYRRKADADTVNCFIDIGSVATRAFITCGPQILFARVIPVGGDHFSKAVSQALNITLEEAKTLRIKLAHAQLPTTEARSEAPAPVAAQVATPPAPAEEDTGGFALLNAGIARSERNSASELPFAQPATEAPQTAPSQVQPVDRGPLFVPASGDPNSQLARVSAACEEPLRKLVHELDLCRRYHESTFPNKPVMRLVFVGGEARQRVLCQSIAQQLGIAAQVGDPMVRMGRVSEVGIECGIDRRLPQPSWAVAIGLSMGPVSALANVPKSDRAAVAMKV